ncbi:unnamed protein product [Malus baccata var. baccata]
MKPGFSSLNPYAAAYIPLSKRETDDRTYVTTKDSSRSNESVWFGNPQNFTHNQHHSKAYLESDAPGTATLQSPKSYAVKSYPAHGYYGSSSQNVIKVSENEDFDMDMEYLGMSFPGISDQSLSDVYLANRGDLDATIDMLNQLEVTFIFFFFNVDVKYYSRCKYHTLSSTIYPSTVMLLCITYKYSNTAACNSESS